MRVCVIGLGKIGLPLAVQFASKGCTVIGYDINPKVVELVSRGVSPHQDEEALPERLAEVVNAGRLTATTDGIQAVARSEVAVIIVPVDIDEASLPNFSALDAASSLVATSISEKTLVIIEPTVPVTTTRQRVGGVLEAAGKRLGADYLLAYSPERVYSGRIFSDLARYPKVVGGVDEESTRAAVDFYSKVLDAPITGVRDAETSEFTKLAEAIYRDVNIALANDFAMRAAQWGIDVTEAIVAANSQPFSHIHQPGVGVGGHCIPVYPYFLTQNGERDTLISIARRINDGMAGYTKHLLLREYGDLTDKKVLILGLAYRPNVKEAAHSSTLLLADELKGAGANVLVHDPLFTPEEIESLGLRAASLEPPPDVDVILIQSYHAAYRNLDFGRFSGCNVIVDGRNVLAREEIEAKGIKYLGIGR